MIESKSEENQSSLKLLFFVIIVLVLRIEFLKYGIFRILNFQLH